MLATIISYFRQPTSIIKNFLWRFPKRKSSMQHVFIVGAPRSGTTLLQLVTASHPSFSSLEGETGLFTWQNVFDTRRKYGYFGCEEIQKLFTVSTSIVEFFDNLANKILQQNGGTRLVEKTPQHVLRIGFLLKHYPNAQFINVFRDGRDCFCSARNSLIISQAASIRRFAGYWRRCVMARLAQGERKNILDVKYEDFTSNPEKELRRIMEFLGEEFFCSQIDPDFYSRDKRSKLPAFSKLSGPIDTQSQRRWTKECSPQEISTFNRIAGRQLLMLGYDIDKPNNNRGCVRRLWKSMVCRSKRPK